MDVLKLSKLSISNFRNLTDEIINFSSGINCILGANGNGKTNILEAIYVVTQRKSFRKNTSFPQYLSMDGEKPEILFSSLFHDLDTNPVTYSGKLYQEKNEFYLNGKATRKRHLTPTVFIGPFDSHSFHNSASFRRNWFDNHISLMYPAYKTVLNKYNQAIRFRNSLLGKGPSNSVFEQIKAIDVGISQYSFELIQYRVEFLKLVKDFFSLAFKELFSFNHQLEIVLETKFAGFSAQDIFNSMQSKVEKEVYTGRTEYGVHRDDYLFLFDGLNAYDFCSLGQQKMSYLALIFAYIELFKYKFSSYPIVLIDDVSGELDKVRWGNLINYIRKRDFQVFITTANENFRHELERIDTAHKFYVEDGNILIQ